MVGIIICIYLYIFFFLILLSINFFSRRNKKKKKKRSKKLYIPDGTNRVDGILQACLRTRLNTDIAVVSSHI